jgi:hypothetical protein
MHCNEQQKIINRFENHFFTSFGCTCKKVRVNVRQLVPVQEI